MLLLTNKISGSVFLPETLLYKNKLNLDAAFWAYYHYV